MAAESQEDGQPLIEKYLGKFPEIPEQILARIVREYGTDPDYCLRILEGESMKCLYGSSPTHDIPNFLMKGLKAIGPKVGPGSTANSGSPVDFKHNNSMVTTSSRHSSGRSTPVNVIPTPWVVPKSHAPVTNAGYTLTPNQYSSVPPSHMSSGMVYSPINSSYYHPTASAGHHGLLTTPGGILHFTAMPSGRQISPREGYPPLNDNAYTQGSIPGLTGAGNRVNQTSPNVIYPPHSTNDFYQINTTDVATSTGSSKTSPASVCPLTSGAQEVCLDPTYYSLASNHSSHSGQMHHPVSTVGDKSAYYVTTNPPQFDTRSQTLPAGSSHVPGAVILPSPYSTVMGNETQRLPVNAGFVPINPLTMVNRPDTEQTYVSTSSEAHIPGIPNQVVRPGVPSPEEYQRPIFSGIGPVSTASRQPIANDEYLKEPFRRSNSVPCLPASIDNGQKPPLGRPLSDHDLNINLDQRTVQYRLTPPSDSSLEDWSLVNREINCILPDPNVGPTHNDEGLLNASLQDQVKLLEKEKSELRRKLEKMSEQMEVYKAGNASLYGKTYYSSTNDGASERMHEQSKSPAVNGYLGTSESRFISRRQSDGEAAVRQDSGISGNCDIRKFRNGHQKPTGYSSKISGTDHGEVRVQRHDDYSPSLYSQFATESYLPARDFTTGVRRRKTSIDGAVSSDVSDIDVSRYLLRRSYSSDSITSSALLQNGWLESYGSQGRGKSRERQVLDDGVEHSKRERKKRQRPHTYRSGSYENLPGSTSVASRSRSTPTSRGANFSVRGYQMDVSPSSPDSSDVAPQSSVRTSPRKGTPFAPSTPQEIDQGMEVLVTRARGKIGRGKVKYIGCLPSKSDTVYLGLELDREDGEHDGKFNGQRFFKCKPNHGIFVPFDNVVMAYT